MNINTNDNTVWEYYVYKSWHEPSYKISTILEHFVFEQLKF